MFNKELFSYYLRDIDAYEFCAKQVIDKIAENSIDINLFYRFQQNSADSAVLLLMLLITNGVTAMFTINDNKQFLQRFSVNPSMKNIRNLQDFTTYLTENYGRKSFTSILYDTLHVITAGDINAGSNNININDVLYDLIGNSVNNRIDINTNNSSVKHNEFTGKSGKDLSKYFFKNEVSADGSSDGDDGGSDYAVINVEDFVFNTVDLFIKQLVTDSGETEMSFTSYYVNLISKDETPPKCLISDAEITDLLQPFNVNLCTSANINSHRLKLSPKTTVIPTIFNIEESQALCRWIGKLYTYISVYGSTCLRAKLDPSIMENSAIKCDDCIKKIQDKYEILATIFGVHDNEDAVTIIKLLYKFIAESKETFNFTYDAGKDDYKQRIEEMKDLDDSYKFSYSHNAIYDSFVFSLVFIYDYLQEIIENYDYIAKIKAKPPPLSPADSAKIGRKKDLPDIVINVEVTKQQQDRYIKICRQFLQITEKMYEKWHSTVTIDKKYGETEENFVNAYEERHKHNDTSTYLAELFILYYCENIAEASTVLRYGKLNKSLSKSTGESDESSESGESSESKTIGEVKKSIKICERLQIVYNNERKHRNAIIEQLATKKSINGYPRSQTTEVNYPNYYAVYWFVLFFIGDNCFAATFKSQQYYEQYNCYNFFKFYERFGSPALIINEYLNDLTAKCLSCFTTTGLAKKYDMADTFETTATTTTATTAKAKTMLDINENTDYLIKFVKIAALQSTFTTSNYTQVEYSNLSNKPINMYRFHSNNACELAYCVYYGKCMDIAENYAKIEAAGESGESQIIDTEIPLLLLIAGRNVKKLCCYSNKDDPFGSTAITIIHFDEMLNFYKELLLNRQFHCYDILRFAIVTDSYFKRNNSINDFNGFHVLLHRYFNKLIPDATERLERKKQESFNKAMQIIDYRDYEILAKRFLQLLCSCFVNFLQVNHMAEPKEIATLQKKYYNFIFKPYG